MRHSLPNKNNGNAAIALIVLLLIAGAAAWWFLFRTPAATVLPGDSNARESRGGSAYSSGTGTEQGSVKEMDAASSGGSQVSSSDLPPADHANIDWKARHAELKQKYSDEFTEPEIGMRARILLVSGNVAEGTVNDLTRDSITLRIAGTGKATYNRNQISRQSQLLLFKDVFAEYSAQENIAAEKADLQSAAPSP